MKEALALCESEAAGDRLRRSGIPAKDPTGERLGSIEYEDFIAAGRSRLRLADAERRMGRDRAQLHLGHHRRSERRRLSPSRRASAGDGQCHHLRHGSSIRSICGRCRCSTATAGASRGRSRSVAGTHVCLRAVRATAMFDAIADAQGHASVRRADRDVDAAQRDGRRDASRCRMRSKFVDRRGAAARGRARPAMKQRGLQRHASFTA